MFWRPLQFFANADNVDQIQSALQNVFPQLHLVSTLGLCEEILAETDRHFVRVPTRFIIKIGGTAAMMRRMSSTLLLVVVTTTAETTTGHVAVHWNANLGVAVSVAIIATTKA